MLTWLKKYKIIFETLVAASLTVMGVLVSIAAMNVSKKANEANKLIVRQNELVEQQYELERYGAEPVFDVQWEIGEDGLPYYVVRNIGAEIHDLWCTVTSILSVSCYDDIDFGFLIKRVWKSGGEYGQSSHWRIPIDQEELPLVLRVIEEVDGIYPSFPYWLVFELSYRNYRNEACSSKIRVIPLGNMMPRKNGIDYVELFPWGRLSIQFDYSNIKYFFNDLSERFLSEREFDITISYVHDAEEIREKVQGTIANYFSN
ncbi:MAG: hypothetical protein FWE98_00140 [Oscillospiraceae bacterium]|nr:hypothetical protein [Oscillospiraceae bacterium]